MPAKVCGSVGLVPNRSDSIHVAAAMRADGAECDSGDRQFERATDHATLHLRGGGAQRHADADLLRLARDPIGDDAVDSERGENQAERGEAADQQHEEAARRDGAVHDVLQRAKFGGGLRGIQCAQPSSSRWRRARRASSFVRTTSSAPSGPAWVGGQVHLRAGGVFQTMFADIGDDADHADVPFCRFASRPNGSSPCQNRRAAAWLMMTTRSLLGVSCQVKSRPSLSCMPMAPR